MTHKWFKPYIDWTVVCDFLFSSNFLSSIKGSLCFCSSLGRPDPLTVQTREVKERSVTIRWNPVFDGGRPITSYMVDLKNKQSKRMETFGHQAANYLYTLESWLWISSMCSCCTASWDTGVRTEVSNPELTQVTLVDLRPAKSYNIRMFVVNSVGMSEASNVLTITTKEAGRVSQDLSFVTTFLILTDGHFQMCFPCSTRGSTPGYAHGGPHLSQYQSDVEGRVTLKKL